MCSMAPVVYLLTLSTIIAHQNLYRIPLLLLNFLKYKSVKLSYLTNFWYQRWKSRAASRAQIGLSKLARETWERTGKLMMISLRDLPLFPSTLWSKLSMRKIHLGMGLSGLKKGKSHVEVIYFATIYFACRREQEMSSQSLSAVSFQSLPDVSSTRRDIWSIDKSRKTTRKGPKERKFGRMRWRRLFMMVL